MRGGESFSELATKDNLVRTRLNWWADTDPGRGVPVHSPRKFFAQRRGKMFFCVSVCTYMCVCMCVSVRLSRMYVCLRVCRCVWVCVEIDPPWSLPISSSDPEPPWILPQISGSHSGSSLRSLDPSPDLWILPGSFPRSPNLLIPLWLPLWTHHFLASRRIYRRRSL